MEMESYRDSELVRTVTAYQNNRATVDELTDVIRREADELCEYVLLGASAKWHQDIARKIVRGQKHGAFFIGFCVGVGTFGAAMVAITMGRWVVG